MKKHKLYMTDETGSFNGYDQKKVWVDTRASELRIANTKVPLAEITACEVRALAKGKGSFLAVDVCGPSINNYEPTTIMLIHKNFSGVTKMGPMQEVVAELLPLIEGNTQLERSSEEDAIPAGTLQAQYALDVSFFIGFYRKLWYNYDSRTKILSKTILLMLIGGIVNVVGILLIAVPVDNYKMSRNLVLAGWSKRSAFVTYLLTTIPAYALWTVIIIRWTTDKG